MRRQRVSLRENQLQSQESAPIAGSALTKRRVATARTRKESSSPAAALPPARIGRYAKAQHSDQWGKPITSCTAATRLNDNSTATGVDSMPAKRITAPRNFLPRVALLGPKQNGALSLTASAATRPPSSLSPNVRCEEVDVEEEEIFSADRRRIKLAKAIRLSDQQNKSYVYLCKPVKKVKELLTARPMRDSSEDEKWQRIHSCNAYCQTTDSLGDTREAAHVPNDTQPSNGRTDPDEYDLAPLPELGSASTTSFNSSSAAMFLSACQSHRQADGDNTMERSFHSMLHNQLFDVRQRESLLKSALSSMQIADAQQPVQPLPANANAKCKDSKDTIPVRQRDLDQVFQNIPTLQREISLLQELGEKLEAMLRCRSGMCNGNCCQRTPSVYYIPRQTQSPYSYDMVSLTRIGFRHVIHLPRVQQHAVRKSQLRQQGCIQEFRIETKTLTELKSEDETQCFYLPVNGPHCTRLQCTSFRKLKQNPSMLLQQLRPKSPNRSFNLLDHDPMFFNNVALGETRLSPESGDYQPFTRLSKARSCDTDVVLCSSCDAVMSIEQISDSSTASSSESSLLPLCSSCRPMYDSHTASGLERLLRKHQRCTLSPQMSLLNLQQPKLRSKRRAPSVKRKPQQQLRLSGGFATVHALKKQQRKKTAKRAGRTKAVRLRQVAPVRHRYTQRQLQPKLHLFKTVLVGIAQILVFILLILALTYPEPRCD